MCAFLLALHRLGEDARTTTMLTTGALFGSLVLVRPTNGIALLALPILHGERTVPVIRSVLARRADFCRRSSRAPVSWRCNHLLWHAQTGHWLEHGYRGEGFYWMASAALPRIVRRAARALCLDARHDRGDHGGLAVVEVGRRRCASRCSIS
jgi:hypothetical protein